MDGKKLKELINNSGISQAQIAEYLKVTPAAANKWFNGTPKKITIDKILKAVREINEDRLSRIDKGLGILNEPHPEYRLDREPLVEVLERFADLKERGYLSAEEYERVKRLTIKEYES